MADIDRAKRIIIDYTADELRFWAGIFRTIPLADDAAFVNVAILYRSAFDSINEAHWPTIDSGRYTPYYLDAWCDGRDIWTPDMRSFVYHGMARRFEAMAEQYKIERMMSAIVDTKLGTIEIDRETEGIELIRFNIEIERTVESERIAGGNDAEALSELIGKMCRALREVIDKANESIEKLRRASLRPVE